MKQDRFLLRQALEFETAALAVITVTLQVVTRDLLTQNIQSENLNECIITMQNSEFLKQNRYSRLQSLDEELLLMLVSYLCRKLEDKSSASSQEGPLPEVMSSSCVDLTRHMAAVIDKDTLKEIKGQNLVHRQSGKSVPVMMPMGTTDFTQEFHLMYLTPQEWTEVRAQQDAVAPRESEVNVINPDHEAWLKQELKQYPSLEDDVFYDGKISRALGVEFDLTFKDKPRPFRSRAFRLAPTELDALNKQIDKYLKLNVIRESSSPWASPTFIVPKKTVDPVTGKKEYRLVIDYRELNKQTYVQNFPLPKIDQVMDKLGGSKVFTCLDLRSGYNHITMSKNAREASAFVCEKGHFEFNVLPFGIHAAPPYFQQMINTLLRKPIEQGYVQVYLDDILIFSEDEDSHRKHVAEVLRLLAMANMRIRVDKCHWFQRELRYLGHVISEDGIRMDPDKVQAMAEYERPTTVKKLHSFLGMFNWYGKFIPKLSLIGAPLYELLKCKPLGKTKKPQKDPEILLTSDPNRPDHPVWTKECEDAFVALRKSLTDIATSPLAFPDQNKGYEVYTDSCNKAIGGVLQQDGRPIAFYSKKLNPTQAKWSIYEQEAYALYCCMDKWRHYVLNGHTTHCFTDNNALSCLLKQKYTNPKQARWCSFLGQFDIELHFVKGKDNQVADALSRHFKECDLIEIHYIEHLCKISESTGEERSMGRVGDSKEFENLRRQIYSVDIHGEETEEEDVSDDYIHTFDFQDDTIRRDEWYEAYMLDTQLRPLIIKDERKLMMVNKTMPKGRLCQAKWSGGLLRSRGQVIVPKVLRNEFLLQAHGDHVGMRKMLDRLKHFWWPEMELDAEKFCKECIRCIRAKGTGKKVRTMPHALQVPAGPYQRLHFDFVGPFEEVTVNGCTYNYIFSVVDAFSKFAWAIPCKQAPTAKESAIMYMNYVYTHINHPDVIICDNGPQFIAGFQKEFAKLVDIDLRYSSAYHAQTNGTVERWHRDLNAGLRICLMDLKKDKNWLNVLGRVVHTHNTTYHSSIGMSPYEVLHGERPVGPIEKFAGEMGLNFSEAERTVEDIITAQGKAAKKLALQSEYYNKEMARRKLLWDPHSETYRHDKVTQLKAGDMVLLRTDRWRHMPKARLQPRVLGPYKIEKVVGKTVWLEESQQFFFDRRVDADDLVLYETPIFKHPEEPVFLDKMHQQDSIPKPAVLEDSVTDDKVQYVDEQDEPVRIKDSSSWFSESKEIKYQRGGKEYTVNPARVIKYEGKKGNTDWFTCEEKSTSNQLTGNTVSLTLRQMILGKTTETHRKLHTALYKFLLENPDRTPHKELQQQLHITRACAQIAKLRKNTIQTIMALTLL